MQKKEVLLHCIVHDLKGPLTGIVGALGLLASRDVAPAQREFLDVAMRQASRLDLLIQGILGAFSAEVEALESFAFDPASAPDALACATEAAMSMASAFTLSKVELGLDPDIDDEVDWGVVAEKVRLEKEMARVKSDIARIDAKLANADFVARAPEEVVDGEREKREEAETRCLKIGEALERLKGAA